MGTPNRRFISAGDIIDIERERERIQDIIDCSKKIDERRIMGQFATPYELAKEIISYGLSLLQDDEIQLLEPSFGTGSFFSALLSTNKSKSISNITGYEIDSEIYQKAVSLWSENQYNLICGDFLTAQAKNNYNLLISNPPYVRHHFINKEQKAKLGKDVKKETNLSMCVIAAWIVVVINPSVIITKNNNTGGFNVVPNVILSQGLNEAMLACNGANIVVNKSPNIFRRLPF